MFKRTCVAVAILIAILCFGLIEVDARDIGNGNGQDGGFHERVFEPFSSDTSQTQPVKPPTTPTTPTTPIEPITQPAVEKGDEWLIYWYVCGTDIESDRLPPGDATRCIKEVEAANLSSGKVKILMQAGGTETWGHEKFKPNDGMVGRYLYDANQNWQLLEPLTRINSNDPKTLMNTYEGLVEFLEFGKRFEQNNYNEPEKIHRVFIFVDHGSGSLRGVCSDAFGGGDMLALKEMRDAFYNVWGNTPQNPPFDVVAFDTCITSTYETAVALEGTARYMVGSQESIFGKVMFEYTGLLNDLSDNPGMSAEDFGRVICDTYMNDATANFLQDLATIALTDISLMPKVTQAYEAFGQEALAYAKSLDNPYAFVSNLGRARISSDNGSGGLSREADTPSSWRDFDLHMADLKGFAYVVRNMSNSPKLQQASQNLIDSLYGENTGTGAVIYQKLGSSRLRSGGLSTYYDVGFYGLSDYNALAQDGLAPQAQIQLYSFMNQVSRGTGTKNYIANTSSSLNTNSVNADKNLNALTIEDIAGGPFDFSDLQQLPAYIDEDDFAVLKLNQEQMDRIAAVRCQIAQVTLEKSDADNPFMRMVYLGGNTEVESNWETGEFRNLAFTGKWIMLDDQPLYLQVDSDETTKNEIGEIVSGTELYSIPIMLNDKGYNLLVRCEYPGEKFTIIGARPVVEGSDPEAKKLSNSASFARSAVNGEIRGLKEGDQITPLYLGLDIPFEVLFRLKDVEITPELRDKLVNNLIKVYKGNSFQIVGNSIPIERKQLSRDNLYAYIFELVNPIGADSGWSEAKFFISVPPGDITLSDGKVIHTHGNILHDDESIYDHFETMLEKKFTEEEIEQMEEKFGK